jgi:hypothetical protein
MSNVLLITFELQTTWAGLFANNSKAVIVTQNNKLGIERSEGELVPRCSIELPGAGRVQNALK